jgi:4-hydroxy-tetrahydrodipicolinate reductase
MSAVIDVAVVGAGGRLGRVAAQLCASTPGLRLVASLGKDDDLAAALRKARPLVAFDSTRAGLGAEHGRIMLECGVRPLIGTSGITLEENAALDAQARELGLGGLVVPNFSVGMWLLQRAAVEAARHFAKAEIIEMHHAKKLDAPSGTALDTAERMRAARAAATGASDPIAIHSVRLPGLYAHQVVMFGAAGETYELRHDMHAPDAFAPGILQGIRYAARARGVGRGIGLAFEDRERAS